MTSKEIEFCKEVFEATDNIIGTLDPKEIGGPVNWGDLGCVAVERIERYTGLPDIEQEWRVLVEEAAPDALELKPVILDELRKQGFTTVYVETEW